MPRMLARYVRCYTLCPVWGQKRKSKKFLKKVAIDRSSDIMTKYRSCCPEVFCEKGVLRNFAKFLKTNVFTEHLWTTASINKWHTLLVAFECKNVMSWMTYLLLEEKYFWTYRALRSRNSILLRDRSLS